MPKTKQTPKIETRLSIESYRRFDELSRARGKTRTEVAREALLLFLDHEDKLREDSRESVLEKRMRKMEDRMASLMVRTAIDVGMVFNLMYRNMDPENRADAIAWAYNGAVERLKKKLEGQAAELKDIVKEPDAKDSSKAQLRKGKAR
jgi:hypothetical protein